MDELLESARRVRPECEPRMAEVSFEAKGILYSEALFLVAALGGHRPRHLFESGRARGQSTLLLSLLLPQARVHSYELHRDTEDARVCAARLEGRQNVELSFGDARAGLPPRVGAGDVVVIDGPKGYRGLELAMRCLSPHRAAAVFVHDCHAGSDERRWLGAHHPATLFSDDPRFVEEHADLDRNCDATRSGVVGGWRPYGGASSPSYGPTYAYLRPDPSVSYPRLIRRLAVTRFLARTGRSLRRRLGPRA